MDKSYDLIRNQGDECTVRKLVTGEERLRHFKAVVSSMNKEAKSVWTEIFDELKCVATPGNMIISDVVKPNFTPACGWPEFMEKIWLLKHYLDHTGRLCGDE